MKKYLTSILVAILLVSILTACVGEEVPTEDPDAFMTSVVGTMVSSFFSTQTAMYTPPAPTATAAIATIAPLPTATVVYPTATFALILTPTFIFYSATPATITPTGTLATMTVDASSLAVGCDNLAFIRDVNIPSGTVIEREQDFTKTWKVQNTGTCDWMYQYSLVPSGGDDLGGGATKIQKTVTVWDWSELSVSLQAPKKPGTYTSYWRLSNGQTAFGATLAISIVVSDGSAASTPVP